MSVVPSIDVKMARWYVPVEWCVTDRTAMSLLATTGRDPSPVRVLGQPKNKLVGKTDNTYRIQVVNVLPGNFPRTLPNHRTGQHGGFPNETLR